MLFNTLELNKLNYIKILTFSKIEKLIHLHNLHPPLNFHIWESAHIGIVLCQSNNFRLFFIGGLDKVNLATL